FDLATGREVRRWRLPAQVHRLAYRPDGRALAVGFISPRVASVYDVGDGALLADLPVGAVSSQVVAWHPDGERLAVAVSDPRIQFWDVAARRQVATMVGHVQNVTDLTFHPRAASWPPTPGTASSGCGTLRRDVRCCSYRSRWTAGFDSAAMGDGWARPSTAS